MPIQQMLLGVGAKKKTYMDDVFSTYLYKGNETARAINNGINLSGEGGLVWVKSRNDTHYHHLVDTVRGANEILKANEDETQAGLGNRITGFNNNGFTLGSAGQVNGTSVYKYSSWTWRKCPGFFDIVSYTGNGSNNRQISHDLNSVPGLIIVKSLNDNEPFQVLHRSLGPTKYGVLNTNSQFHDNDSRWNDVAPTSSNFTVGTDDSTNKSGTNYIAYIWAGGASAAATARSVDFDGTGDYLNTTSSSSDFTMGTGDFTVECWVKKDNITNAQGIFQISSTSGGLEGDPNYGSTIAAAYGNHWHTYGAGNYNTDSSQTPAKKGQWQHVAYVRHSGTSKFYVDGEELISYTDTTNYNGTYIAIGGYYSTTYLMEGAISNFRVVKGTAVYTSSFRPPTKPLTSISGTVLLCCNNSSTTGSTTTPVTINSNGDPAASTDSPFDDPAGFVFGENGDQEVIKCGSYIGNGSSTGPEINLGWEPQWWLVKRTDNSANWQLLDSMRGWPDGGNDAYLIPNTTSSEGNYAFGHPTSTGFVLDDSHAAQNANGGEYVYMAIRRPDGYVGKPAEAGTGVFTTVVRSSSTAPRYISNFPVDFALYRNPSGTMDWYVTNRLTGPEVLKTNTTEAETENSDYANFDHNNGYSNQGGSGHQAWMWKRHAGLDVVTWSGTNSSVVRKHNLGKTPEMIWFKCRSSARNWRVYHKGLNGGTNPEDYAVCLNSNSAEGSNTNYMTSTAPTSTTFVSGNDDDTNGAGKTYIALLFASVDGISKVGSYTGTGSSLTITTGFQPRFVIIKKVSGSGANRNWYVLDTTRGWASGNDKILLLSDDDAETNDTDMGAPTSTGFTLTGETHSGWNASSRKYIYYAHA